MFLRRNARSVLRGTRHLIGQLKAQISPRVAFAPLAITVVMENQRVVPVMAAQDVKLAMLVIPLQVMELKVWMQAHAPSVKSVLQEYHMVVLAAARLVHRMRIRLMMHEHVVHAMQGIFQLRALQLV